MRKHALDTKMLPKVWVSWTTTKNGQFNKRYWLNCQTGKKKDVKEPWMYYEGEHNVGWHRNQYGMGVSWSTRNNDKIWVRDGSRLYYAYVKYHKDIDRLEMAVVTMDTSRKEIARTWEYAGTRLFIGKDKSIITEHGKPMSYTTRLDPHHWVCGGLDAIRMILRQHYPDYAVSEFKKFLGRDSFTIGNGSSQKVSGCYSIERWYQTVQKTRSTGKQQKITDELVKMPVSDASGFADEYPIIEDTSDGYYQRKLTGIVYFERLTDGWSVLRSFIRNEDNLHEEWRMYINDDGRTRIVAESNGDWVPSAQVRNKWRNSSYIVNKGEAIANCNRIKYALSAGAVTDKEYEVDFLVTALRFPEIEQLIKLGCGRAARRIANSHTPKADLKEQFGGYFNCKEKNFLRKVGMTKHQFDEYAKVMDGQYGSNYDATRALANMRKMFGNDLSHMDNDSYDAYFEAMQHITRSFYRSLDSWMEYFGLDTMRFFKNLVRLGKKNHAVYGMAYDTMSDYRNLNVGTAPEVDWYFDNYSDLARIHDAVTELKRMQDAERRARWNMSERERMEKDEKKREELDKVRKAYEYEDDDYIIRLPKSSSEIITEGSAQRICIGGYTSRHATGATNLFFLRKKSAPDTPFYAIEMSNGKTIVQIHGYCNKWLGNDPDAIPTVIRWLRKNGIKCADSILTCKAKGYSSCNDYVPMPVVD